MADDTDTAVKTAQTEPPPQQAQQPTEAPAVDANTVAPTTSPFNRLLSPFPMGGTDKFEKSGIGEAEVEEKLRKDNERRTVEAKEMQSILDQKKPIYEALGNLPHPKAPQLENMPSSPRLEMRSSLETFRMPLMWLGIAGSLLTRRPALNAMAAATGMMEGFAVGDKERIELEQQKFKNNVDRALHQNGIEIQKRRALMDDRNMTAEDLTNKLHMYDTQVGDKIAMDKFKSGNFDQLFEYYKFKENLQEKNLKARMDWAERHEREQDKITERIGPKLRNELTDFYPNVDVKSLRGISPDDKRHLDAALDSGKDLEKIAEYAVNHPGAVGLLATASKRLNLDAWKTAPTANNREDFINSTSGDLAKQIDRMAKQSGNVSDAAAAKIMAKMLTTQAFSDAQLYGARGGSIYLDKAFREIYDQSSSPQAFFGVLTDRYGKAQQELSKYHMGIQERSDKDKYPFFSQGPDRFTQKFMENKQAGGKPLVRVSTPDEAAKLPLNTRYQTPDGRIFTR